MKASKEKLKCWYVTNMYEYVVAYVYAGSIGDAKRAGYAIDPSGEAEFTDMRLKRSRGLDERMGMFNLIKDGECFVVDVCDSSNEKLLIGLKYAKKVGEDVYFHPNELNGDEYE